MKSLTEIRLIAAMAAVATLLTGCGKESDNTVEDNPVAARITSVIDGMTTRATGTAWAANDRIGLTATTTGGTTLCTNAPYITTTGDGVFTAEGEDFYFQDKAEVTFTAYYPFLDNRYLLDGIAYLGIGGDESQKPENQPKFDFLFATATGSAATPNVEFRFRHCMSRIVLNFLPGDGIASLDDIEYRLNGIKVVGTFNTLTGGAQAIDMGDISPSVPYNPAGMSSPLILFPQQSDDDKTLTLTMRGTEYTATFKFKENPKNGNVRELAAGHTYTYNVTINNATMTISPATIGEWSDGGSENINSTN